MQANNGKNIILDDIKNSREYRIDTAIYDVNRIFGSKRTVKDVLLEKISSEKVTFSN